MELPFFHPGLSLSGNKREKFQGKRGGFPFSGGLEFVTVYFKQILVTLFQQAKSAARFGYPPTFG
jgi:hypothetical protein